MKYFVAAFFVISFYLSPVSNPEPILLTGVVTDATTGSPVSGAVIQSKNDTASAVSAAQGEFSITVSRKTKILICTAPGYETKEIRINPGGQPMYIKLQPSALQNEEVAVMAYDALQGKAAGIISGNRRDALASSAPRTKQEDLGFNTEDYDVINENRFLETSTSPLSTFSIDVDGASYSNVRRFIKMGQAPPAGAVRIEELINYFHYQYPQPIGRQPFSINTEIAECPWNKQHHLVMIGLQGKKIPTENLPPSNLVFLVDVSGSMMDENKLPLVKSSLKLLSEQLREQDKVSIVVYAGNAGLVLPPARGHEKRKIMEAIEALEAGGSTAGGAGIQLAYKVATENLIKEGNNRVILCTDGDFNVGTSSDAELVKMIEEKRKSGVYLTVLGYGMGNYKDNKMQKLANHGNGNHAYIDNHAEAKKVLVSEFGGTLFTIAKDVKLQVEFNPEKIQGYRLIGYENRMLNKEDFNNDQKDAGEIGSGHTVTALYELIPTGVKSNFIEKTDPLKYQNRNRSGHSPSTQEIMTIKFRYKQPDGHKSELIEHPVTGIVRSGQKTSENFRFVAAVAEFGMLLTNSEFKQESSFLAARALAAGALGKDAEGYRSEFLVMVNEAGKLIGEEVISHKKQR